MSLEGSTPSPSAGINMVSVVYAVGTPACEAGGKGSTPFGHPFSQIRRYVFTKVLNRPTLVLNRNWQAVNVANVARALVLLWNESARVVDPADYQTYTWEDWSKLRPGDDERFIQAVRFRLRVPEVLHAGPWQGLETLILVPLAGPGSARPVTVKWKT